MQAWIARACAGALATVPMTAVMLALYRRLPREQRYPLPPREITETAAHYVGQLDRGAGDRTLTHASLIAHFGFGAFAAAVYPPLTTMRMRRPLLHGSLFGIGVWAASYLGWVPALGILKPAARHPARRNALMIAAHLVWGSSAALAAQRLARDGSGTGMAGGDARAAEVHKFRPS